MKSTQENRIEQIEFSERDKLFITANSDGYVHLWDAGSLEALFAFQAHELPVITLALSADNSFIVTGSPDETVRLWRIKSSSQDE
jgi:WD40 repeat protein